MLLRLVFFSLLLLLLPSSVHAQKRVALVIGNSAYEYAPELTNPKNDAADMAAALRRHGFLVIDGFDLSRAALESKIRDFTIALRGAEAGVLFYAGHGLQVFGQNYIIPVDARVETASTLDLETVRLDIVQRIMENETPTNILFLDACRDNPFTRNLMRTMGTRSAAVGRGLAPVASGLGTLISFSTEPGNVASDGTGRRNSPFAGALVKHVSSSNYDLSALLIDVRNDVISETQGRQIPWEHSALRGRFYFKGQPAPQSVQLPSQLQLSEAERTWNLAKDTESISVLEAFINRYGDTFYAELARERLSRLKRPSVAANTNLPPPPVLPNTNTNVAAAPAIGFTIKPNTVASGTSSERTIYDSSRAECEKSCAQSLSCKVFSINKRVGFCYLYDSANLGPSTEYDSGIRN